MNPIISIKYLGSWSQRTEDERICYDQSSQASSSQSSPSQVSSQPSISASPHSPNPISRSLALKPGEKSKLKTVIYVQKINPLV